MIVAWAQNTSTSQRSANAAIAGNTFGMTQNSDTTVIAPVITSSGTASGTVNQSFSYPITATNSPTSYGASGLPAGLSVNPSTGLISGTPTISGTFNVTVTASNAGGTGIMTLITTIAPTNYSLTVTAPVNGWITGASGTINCGTSCSVSLPAGTPVVLTANPNSGYTFSGWSGSALCVNQNPCIFSMPTSAVNLVANFKKSDIASILMLLLD